MAAGQKLTALRKRELQMQDMLEEEYDMSDSDEERPKTGLSRRSGKSRDRS